MGEGETGGKNQEGIGGPGHGRPRGTWLRKALAIFRHVFSLFRDLKKDSPFFQLEAGRIPMLLSG